MKIIRQGYIPQEEKMYHCKYCDCLFEVESEKDYDEIIPLCTWGDEHIKQAIRFIVICPTCGQHVVKEVYKYGDGSEEWFH